MNSSKPQLPALALACLALAAGGAWAQQSPAAPARASASGFHAMLEPSVRLGHPAMQKALDMLGARYVWGGTSERDGMDCSGFVWRSYQDATGVRLPRTALEMARQLRVVMPHELRAGDLVFFNTRGRPYSHVGIYLGGGMFAHSPRAGQIARMDTLEATYWLSAFDGARRPASRTGSGRGREAFALLLEPSSEAAEPAPRAKRDSPPRSRRAARAHLVATASIR